MSDSTTMAAVVASLVWLGVVTCQGWRTDHDLTKVDSLNVPGGANGLRGEASSMAGYAEQLRSGSANISPDYDAPFIADVWLKGGAPISDGPESTTFKFAFEAGQMPRGKRRPSAKAASPPVA